MNGKSNLNTIQAKVEVLITHFGYDNKSLKNELESILKLVEQEQNLRTEIANSLSKVIGKI